ncbi:MAG: sigma-54 dependent transcriptional regulator [Vicinamibacterales bacterium]
MSSPLQFIGASSATRVIREEIEYASKSDAKVLITGESGVGKEVVAQMVHQQSRRRSAPLVTINCAGVPDTLLASELFGHVRGSFTDAHRDKPGWLEQANRGTIFLDEVGEMSLQMQSLLLRFLENGEIQRVGSEKLSSKVDVRVIAATNRKLVDRIASNEFREDLFYRLNVIHIPVPPLRERREDIPLLVDYFLRQFSKNHGVERPHLSDGAAAQLTASDWPGNVRQIRNVAERLILRAKGGIITIADLPREVLSANAPNGEPADDVRARPICEQLFDRMVRGGETFWAIVYEPFMLRDLTRDDLRAIVRHGLNLTHGSYKGMAQLFNVPADYKRLLNFLRKYQCHLPIHEFRSISVQRTHSEVPLDRAVGD